MIGDTSHKQNDSKFEMRAVEIEHLAQYDELLRYVFQVDTADLEESGYEDNELRQAKRPILKRSEVIGWFNDDKLVSSLSIYPCKVNIHGKTYDMAGVTGVGTYPEFANKGLMQSLIIEAIHRMRANKQWISYLYPFSIPFYRHKGWEIISDHMTFNISDTQLPKPIDVVGHVEDVRLTILMCMQLIIVLLCKIMAHLFVMFGIGKSTGVGRMRLNEQQQFIMTSMRSQWDIFYIG